MINEILKILYPNYSSLGFEDLEKYKEDKQTLLRFENEFNKELSNHNKEDLIEIFGEKKFYRFLIDHIKKKYDPETKINKYINELRTFINEDSFIKNYYDFFIKMLHFEFEKERENANISDSFRKISIDEVIYMTSQFFKELDDELYFLFNNFIQNGKLKLVELDETSRFVNGYIYYNFNGLLGSANTLVHEFLHYYISIKSKDISYDRENYSIFNEFLSIYYENAFSYYMRKIGFINDAELIQMLSHRCKIEFMSEPNNMLDIMLKFISEYSDNLDLTKIEKVLLGYDKNINDLLFFISEHYFPLELVNGMVQYKLCNSMALSSSYDMDTMKKNLSLAKCVVSKSLDQVFIEEYLKISNNKKILIFKF